MGGKEGKKEEIGVLHSRKGVMRDYVGGKKEFVALMQKKQERKNRSLPS